MAESSRRSGPTVPGIGPPNNPAAGEPSTCDGPDLPLCSVKYGDTSRGSGKRVGVTVADWAALAITLGWAGTAFWVVHVITRPSGDARPNPPGDDLSDPLD